MNLSEACNSMEGIRYAVLEHRGSIGYTPLTYSGTRVNSTNPRLYDSYGKAKAKAGKLGKVVTVRLEVMAEVSDE